MTTCKIERQNGPKRLNMFQNESKRSKSHLANIKQRQVSFSFSLRFVIKF